MIACTASSALSPLLINNAVKLVITLTDMDVQFTVLYTSPGKVDNIFVDGAVISTWLP